MTAGPSFACSNCGKLLSPYWTRCEHCGAPLTPEVAAARAAAGSPVDPAGSIGFMDAVRQAFRRWHQLRGRASRAEYWWYYLFNVVASIPLGMVAGLLLVVAAVAQSPGLLILCVLGLFAWTLVVGVPGFSLLIRRLHDTDRSGWWVLAALIPLVGAVAILVLTVLDGTKGANRFGPRPGYGDGGEAFGTTTGTPIDPTAPFPWAPEVATAVGGGTRAVVLVDTLTADAPVDREDPPSPSG